MIIDADSHIMEPGSMWKTYIEPAYREHCIYVKRNEEKGDQLIVNDQPFTRIPRLGGVKPELAKEILDWNSLELARYESYEDSCLPESYDPKKRIKWMEDTGVDKSFLFPSLSLIWPKVVKDNAYIRAHFQAYNRWIMDFASADAEKLIPIALTTLYDEELAIKDLIELKKQQFKMIMLPYLDASLGTPFSEKYDKFWSAVEELNLSVCLHKIAIPLQLRIQENAPMAIDGNGSLFNHVNEILAGQLCLTSIFDTCIVDRHPNIQFAFMECNAGWLPGWLDRIEESYETLSGKKNLKIPKYSPRDYMNSGKKRFLFTLGPEENLHHLKGFEDNLMVASDFPHPGCSTTPVLQWQKQLADLSIKVQQQILGLNAISMLDLV